MSDPTDPAVSRRRRMGAAIRRYRGELSQAELAGILGMSQAGISLWESGGVDFTYEQIRSVETALGLQIGSLGRAAGYVGVTSNVMPFTVKADSVDDVVSALRAASTLGLHVAIANRFDDVDIGRDERWLVVVGDDEPEPSMSS